MFNRIAVLCTGNICRSPIAEGLLRTALPGRTVFSAGTAAVIGAPADPHSVAVMRANGLDIAAHRAQQATQPMLQGADLILVLDQGHADWVTRRYPQLRGRVHKVCKWRDNADVDDPYRHPREAFARAYVEIEQGVQDWLQRL
ncbi:low molecular weight phosphotyrosine protein phosphatase [Flagellatimonas centrodinii]|uniref:low molecular weight protein-tyrosine-phosphatase n=1 Tax=Flagellatimonas centrodinii TaxID=2806210 RepID=UPI001FEDFB43|nr:low molecular weight protein-tyrosine-phosphatase [Flagellatimonas centrodinii]ULQ45315.1 low molecular weight phosphotyrosine protein phosphatase [Flagellatimonas centrodinii]